MSTEVISTLKIQKKKRKYYDIFWTYQFLFMKFPPSSLGNLIIFLAHEKLIDHIKSWYLHSQIKLQNFRKTSSGNFELFNLSSL